MPVSDDDNGEDEDEDDEDDEWEQRPVTPQAPKPVSPPGRNPMQAIAMPRKKRSPGDKILTVRLQGGGRARLPVSPEPTYTGVGDYARRVRAAGDSASFLMLRLTAQSSREAAPGQSIVGLHSTEIQTCSYTLSSVVADQPSCSLQESISNHTLGVSARFELLHQSCTLPFNIRHPDLHGHGWVKTQKLSLICSNIMLRLAL